MISRLLQWWYTEGWRKALFSIQKSSISILEKFSIPILLKTLFEPWKQLTSYAGPGSTVGDKISVLFDNGFARTFGFIIRSFLIFFATLYVFFVALCRLVLVIVWPVLPLVPFLAIFMGVF